MEAGVFVNAIKAARREEHNLRRLVGAALQRRSIGRLLTLRGRRMTIRGAVLNCKLASGLIGIADVPSAVTDEDGLIAV
jgi:hypothetical protein